MDLNTALLEFADGPRGGYEYTSPWYADCIAFTETLLGALRDDVTDLQTRLAVAEAALAVLPTVKVTSLPTAGIAYYGKIYVLQGALNNDTAHICIRLLGSYNWKTMTLL